MTGPQTAGLGLRATISTLQAQLLLHPVLFGHFLTSPVWDPRRHGRNKRQGNAGLDNHSLGQDFFIADNDDNETKTVYLHMLDFAGNVETIGDSIFFLPDGEAPVIDNVWSKRRSERRYACHNQREISVEVYADPRSGLYDILPHL